MFEFYSGGVVDSSGHFCGTSFNFQLGKIVLTGLGLESENKHYRVFFFVTELNVFGVSLYKTSVI